VSSSPFVGAGAAGVSNALKTLERVKRSNTIHYGQRIEINQMHQMQRAFVLDEMLDALLDVLPLESGCILPTIGTAKIARRIIGGWLLR
jgi:hypothetical protein